MLSLASRTCFAALIGISAATVAGADENAPNPLRNAYFGETHMHTAYSLDAYIGGTRLLLSLIHI